jgi:hypothetical protein
MPDSFPPLTWGPPPFEERDLDALLSGGVTETPVALRQVADALTALRAEPAQAELSGEAAARAEFRAFAESLGLGLDEAARADGHPYAEVLSALALRAGRPTARHRIIRGTRGGAARPGRPARRHRAGPPARRISRRGAVVTAVGVTAALVVAVFVGTGSLPGPHPLGHSSAAGTPSVGGSPSKSSPSQNLQARSATPVPSHKATPTHSARETPSSSPSSVPSPSPADLCRAYYRDLLSPQPHDARTVEHALLVQIAKLAGDPAHFDVNMYCVQHLHGYPGSQDNSGGGNQRDSQNPPGQSQQPNPPA